MDQKLPFISVITVNYNGKHLLTDCLASLASLDYPRDKFEVILVDNGSSDGSVDFVKADYPKVRVILNDSNNYCRANNLGVKESKAEFIAFLNNDTRVDKNWLIELVKLITSDDTIGAVGSKILLMDGRIDSTGHEESSDLRWIDRGSQEEDRGQYDEAEEVSSVSNCATLFRRAAFEQAGGFDEEFNMYLEDVDISIRLRKNGWRIRFCPKSIVFHKHHGTSNDDDAELFSEKNRLLLAAKHRPDKLTEVIVSSWNRLKERMACKDLDIAAKDKHIFDNSREITEKNNQISKLKEEAVKDHETLSAIDGYAQSLRKELEKERQALRDIYASTAFRFIVSPLWSAISKARNIFSAGHKISTSEASQEVPAMAICTIISKNYLSYARVLAGSFLEHNKGQVFVLLTDKLEGYFDREKEKFTLIEIDRIKFRIPEFDSFCFKYNITELNTAVKPYYLEYLFEEYKLDKLVYFDPDILITDGLGDISKMLERSSMVLIPHITQPYPDTKKPFELDILKSGVYNLGFLALSYTDSTKRLLRWWKERLSHHCRIDLEKGLFVDQKWIDLIPGFFADAFILRDPTYNIAYWNLHYRDIRMINGDIYAGDKKAHFLHFSGFDPLNPEKVSKHQDRFRLSDLSHASGIFDSYRDRLMAEGFRDSKEWPCVFEYFDNGVRIPVIARKIYSELSSEMMKSFGNPFTALPKDSYFNWLNRPMDSAKPQITNLMYEVYKIRQDVQFTYPEIFGTSRAGFCHWFNSSAGNEHGLDISFFLSQTQSLMSERRTAFPRFTERLYFHSRNALKSILKKIFGKNLWMINNLRMTEIRFNRRLHSIRAGADMAQAQRSPVRGVNVLGYLTSELGVGEGARANVRSMRSVGIDVALVNIDNHSPSRKCDSSFSGFCDTAPYDINLIHVNADMFSKLYIEKGANCFKDKYNIGFWNWELSEFLDEYRGSFSYCNEVWVPTNFTLSSVAKKSPVPVVKIPLAVSMDNVKDVKRDYFGLSEKEFIFLFIFDFFSYFERKNPLALIQAFKQAFGRSEGVRLVIKCSNSSFDPAAFRRMSELSCGSNITIIDEYFYRDEVNALFSLCDAYVSLHRSEGYGFSMAEAMFFGKPVIATGYSGNTEFMNINNSYLVRYSLKEIEQDAGPYKKGYLWADPDVENAAELMSRVHKNREEAAKIGLCASEYVKKNLSCAAVGKEIKARLNAISRLP
jgi:GT2 family glycosyltransferase/glycosyltransferase involved in cell wall biosynthesis